LVTSVAWVPEAISKHNKVNILGVVFTIKAFLFKW
jgi:hypothetical protein